MTNALAIDAFGETGPIVVLLNGTPTAPAHLTPLAERLSTTYRAWHVHLPGYGRSAPLAPYDLETAHRLVEETVTARAGSEPVHLVGFSGGGYRALALAARGRLNVRSISLIAGLRGFTAEQRAGFPEYARSMRAGVDLSGALPALMLSPAAQTNEAWVKHVKTWATAAPTEAIAAELESVPRWPTTDVSTIAAPILARVGALDVSVPPPMSEEIARLAPHVTLQIVPDVGHTLLLEDFAGTAAAIEAHIASATGSAGA